MLVVGFGIVPIQEQAVFTNLVNSFCILFPDTFIKAGVGVVVNFGMGGELDVERIAGYLKPVLRIVQQGTGVFDMIFVPYALHKDLPFSLNIWESLTGCHYAER